MAATLDDTPAALTVAEQRLVGRITEGNVAALTATEVKTLLAIIEGDVGGDVAEATTWDSPITSLLSNLNRIRNQVLAITGETWGTVSHSLTAIWAKFHATTGHKHSGSADDGGQVDHGDLSGLTDDDHARYFDKDGSKAMTGVFLSRDVTNSAFVIDGGLANTPTGARFTIFGADHPTAPGWLRLYTINAAHTGWIEMIRIAGSTDTPYVDILGRQLSSVKDPVSAQDAATKNYVDTRMQSYAGNPTNNLTPTAINYLCIDTTNHNLYIATTAISSGWRLFTRAT